MLCLVIFKTQDAVFFCLLRHARNETSLRGNKRNFTMQRGIHIVCDCSRVKFQRHIAEKDKPQKTRKFLFQTRRMSKNKGAHTRILNLRNIKFKFWLQKHQGKVSYDDFKCYEEIFDRR